MEIQTRFNFVVFIGVVIVFFCAIEIASYSRVVSIYFEKESTVSGALAVWVARIGYMTAEGLLALAVAVAAPILSKFAGFALTLVIFRVYNFWVGCI